MPLGEPPLGVGTDRTPEERIVVDVIIVARQDEGAELWREAVEDQEALVAMRSDRSWLERSAPHVRSRDQGASIVIRLGGAVLYTTDRVHAERILPASVASSIALGLRPFVENEIGVGRVAKGHPGEDATCFIGIGAG